MDTINKLMTVVFGLIIGGLLIWAVCTYTPPKVRPRPT